MIVRGLLAMSMVAAVGGTAVAVDLPKEVTPEIRAACEKDVRRLCLRRQSSFAAVKACVKKKFRQLNKSCQVKLVRAGL